MYDRKQNPFFSAVYLSALLCLNVFSFHPSSLPESELSDGEQSPVVEQREEDWETKSDFAAVLLVSMYVHPILAFY